MRYELTSNTIQYKGRTLYQIRAIEYKGIVRFGDLGGYVNDKNCLAQNGKCWIKQDAKVIDSRIFDDVRIDSGTVITNSTIHGKMLIGKNVIIDNCELNSWDSGGLIFSNTIIQNKAFHFRSELDNRITNSGYFRLFRYGDAQVICGNEYVKVGCITLTYLQAYNALTGGNDILDKWLKEHYSSSRMWKDHREELIYECKKELQRLGIKYKEEDE